MEKVIDTQEYKGLMYGISQRCSGSCCEMFNLPIFPHEIKASLEAYLKYRDSGLLDDAYWIDRFGEERHCHTNDIIRIASMLIFIGETQISPNSDGKTKFNVNQAMYTCKHFIDNECTVYENRPSMCKNYPFSWGGSCKYKGCTLKAKLMNDVDGMKKVS